MALLALFLPNEWMYFQNCKLSKNILYFSNSGFVLIFPNLSQFQFCAFWTGIGIHRVAPSQLYCTFTSYYDFFKFPHTYNVIMIYGCRQLSIISTSGFVI